MPTTKPRKKARSRALTLTAVYLPTSDGWYAAEVLEASGVYTQGRTFEAARTNLIDAIRLMLEEAPHQFGKKRTKLPPGAISEKILVLLPS